MEQEPRCSLYHLDWLQMSQLTDNAEDVGRAINTKLDHASVAKCNIKRSDQVTSLDLEKCCLNQESNRHY